MFKINELILYNTNGDSFPYKFELGINYFKGKNSSGKTVFYSLLDYMLGSSNTIGVEKWFKDLKEVSINLTYNDISYLLTRTKDKDISYISILGEEFESKYPITLREYKLKLCNIFTSDFQTLENIQDFTGEDLTYRTFTMFNFLGEKRQGFIQNFLDKCGDVKYKVKLLSLLNFIFNPNLENIFNLEKELQQLEKEIKQLEDTNTRYNFIKSEINKNIQILALNIQYDGTNAIDIKDRLEKAKLMHEKTVNSKAKNICELETLFSNIDEQIKIYENSRIDIKQIGKENENRQIMLRKLKSLLENNEQLSYLLEPLDKILYELDSTISFSQYAINDNTIAKLKKQRNLLQEEIKKNEPRFTLYSLKEKEKAFVLLENYLKVNILDSTEELKKKKDRIKEIKSLLIELKNRDDVNKIENLSEYITSLYYSAKQVSSFVGDDTNQDDFKINYIKQGNILQPMINESVRVNEHIETKSVNYYTGSMARHTLIQLCGYFGFLRILLEEKKYPIIPIFVCDHLSKSFDDTNVKALGTVINKAMKDIGKENLQIFMFDDESFETLTVIPDHFENLITENKTGFVPFYFAIEKEQNN